MKLDKRTLKGIVKECLIEILAEGIVSQGSRQSSLKKKTLKEAIGDHSRGKTISETHLEGIDSGSSNRKISKRLSYLDNIKFGNEDTPKNNERKIIESISPALSKDPVMLDILADTAKTTLQEQINAESRRGTSAPADKAARIVSENDPTDLFGEASQKWASLAFA